MTEEIQLSPATQNSVQGLVRAKHDVEAWTKNLEQALTDDVNATPPRLTPDEAAAVAKANDVQAPPAPGSAAEATETTAEGNQAQLDAQTKANADAETKAAAPPAKADEKAAKNSDKVPAATSHAAPSR
jgi:membrane protein involved in colicin uptake